MYVKKNLFKQKTLLGVSRAHFIPAGIGVGPLKVSDSNQYKKYNRCFNSPLAIYVLLWVDISSVYTNISTSQSAWMN